MASLYTLIVCCNATQSTAQDSCSMRHTIPLSLMTMMSCCTVQYSTFLHLVWNYKDIWIQTMPHWWRRCIHWKASCRGSAGRKSSFRCFSIDHYLRIWPTVVKMGLISWLSLPLMQIEESTFFRSITRAIWMLIDQCGSYVDLGMTAVLFCSLIWHPGGISHDSHGLYPMG